MLSQIAAFELRMYFIPGAYGLILASVFAKVVTGVDFFNASLQGGDLTQSFAFVMASYVLGHLIQSLGHGFRVFGQNIGPEQRLKTRYWKGYFPSELALFKDSKIIDQSNRQRVLEMLVADGYLYIAQRQEFERPFSEQARELAQGIFVRLNSKSGTQPDSPIKTAEALYQMLRGFFFTSWLGLIVGTITAAYGAATRLWWTGLPRVEHLSWAGLATFCLYSLVAWLIFRYRCRGTGEGYARKVFLTVLKP
jgi:hypothetical protein